MVAAPAIATGIVIAALSLSVGSGDRDLRTYAALTSVAAFLFGVLVAFSIARTKERLLTVHNLIAKCNSALFSIHETMALFTEKDCSRIRDLVDAHLTDQIDYRLVDHHLADASYLELTRAVCAVEPATRQQDSAYKELVALIIRTNTDRSSVEAATGHAMSKLEWTGLGTLLVVLLGLITILAAGSVPGALVVGILAGCLVTLIALLRKLDLLRWHERLTIWEPTARLFRNMGRHPFVPSEVIESGRYQPVGTIRVVRYPDPYPNRSTRIVTLMHLDASGVAVEVTASPAGPRPARRRATRPTANR